MNTKILNGQSIPNIPWQDRPAGCTDPVWRYDQNPVIARDAVKCANSIFNSAVVPFEGGFAGVFRIDDKRRAMQLHAGFSPDGIHWNIDEERIHFVQADKSTEQVNDWLYGYDPRVVFIDDRFWITWCNAFNRQPTIGIGYTFDFKTFYQCENAFLPFNRNGVLFPRRINNKFVMLSRPSDDGHTPFGDMFISQSPDMKYWGEHRHVMSPFMPWESTKIGAGPIPIETDEGWLCFYHGVLQSCNGFVYSFSACILDTDEPWKVKYRCADYLINPREQYECVGDVPNVTFPCAALCDADTGRIAIYYGCADTVVGLAFTTVDETVEYVKNHSSI